MGWLDAVMRRVGRWQGHVPFADADLSAVGARLREHPGFVLGVNGGSHDAGVALVRVEDGVAELILNAEEERFSRKKHDWGAPSGALGEAVATLRALGASTEDVVVRACGWDFAAFVATWTREVAGGFPASLGLLGAEGFLDPTVARRLPALVSEVLGPDSLLAVPHHDAHAWGSVLLSPFEPDEDVLVVVIDGMGDRGSLSVHHFRDRALVPLYDNGSVFDSLGLMYQWLSSTQGGWTPLASEGRFMGAAAWGLAKTTPTTPTFSRCSTWSPAAWCASIGPGSAGIGTRGGPTAIRCAACSASRSRPIGCGIRMRCWTRGDRRCPS